MVQAVKPDGNVTVSGTVMEQWPRRRRTPIVPPHHFAADAEIISSGPGAVLPLAFPSVWNSMRAEIWTR